MNTTPTISMTDIQALVRTRPATTQVMDRIPPHSLESERGVLGCILLAPRECLDRCNDLFSGIESPFYDPRHTVIYDAARELANDTKPVDMVTMTSKLEDQNQLETIGGYAYLSSLVDAVASAANLAFYAETVVDKAMLRQAIRVCTRGVSLAYDDGASAETVVSEIESEALTIRNRKTNRRARTALDLVSKVIKNIEERGKGNYGLDTGFHDLDRLTTGGLKPSEFWVIAARPSMGKTSLGMNIATHVAEKMRLEVKGRHVCVFSLEMTAEDLMERIVSGDSRVNTRKRGPKPGVLGHTDAELGAIAEAAERMAKLPLIIDDDSGLVISTLRSRARSYFSRYNVGLIVVDYIQLMQGEAVSKSDGRRVAVDAISSGLKGMAKELGVPVLCMAQLNRDLEKDKDRKPRLSDLRESGQIEQDADFVGMLYFKDPKADLQQNQIQPVKLLIAKQRNGPRNVDVDLMFFGEFTTFESAAMNTP